MKKLFLLILIASGIIGLALLSSCQSTTSVPTDLYKPSSTILYTPTSSTKSLNQTATFVKETITQSPTEIKPTLTSVITRPSVTSTPTPYPTFLPATPLPDAQNYELSVWNERSAGNLTTLAENNIPQEPVEYSLYDQYINELKASAAALSTSYQEALLRVPSDPLSGVWHGRLIYSQILNNDVNFDRLIRFLIDQLSKEKVTKNNFISWLTILLNKPPNFTFSVIPTASFVRLPETFTEGYLLQLNNGQLGAICSILAKDQNGYHSYTLTSSFVVEDSYTFHHEIHCIVTDLTGDGIDEVLIESEWGGRLVGQNFAIYSLDQWPPRVLELDPDVAITNDISWPSRYYFNRINSEGVPSQLRLTFFPSSWDCWIKTDSFYKWNGVWVAQENYGLADGNDYYNPFCAKYLDLASTPLKLRPVFLEKFIQAQPGNDSLSYKLGIAQALLGDFDESIDSFERLASTSSDPQSEWVQKGRIFLGVFTSKDKIYAACLATSDCSPGEALIALTNTLPGEELYMSAKTLRNYGIPILLSGYLPDSSALWITLRFPGKQKSELWLIETVNDHLAATFVSEISGDFTPQRKSRAAPQMDFHYIRPATFHSFMQHLQQTGCLSFERRTT